MFFLQSILFFILVINTGFCVAETSVEKNNDALYYQENALILDTAKAGSRIVAVGEQGLILYSDDKAESWNISASNVDILLTSVFFLNERSGWATGHQNTILHTSDGGNSWTTQMTSPKGDPLFDILFINDSQGIAIGAYGLFLSTTNGGKNWNTKHLNENDPHLYAVTSIQNKLFLIVGESGTLLRSDNLTDWKTLTSPYQGTLFTLMSKNNLITAAGLRGNIIQSSDNGNSWHKLPSTTISPLQNGTTLSNNKIIIGGPGGSLIISDKTGRSFNRILFPINQSITNIIQISPTDLLISGNFGLRKSPINITLLTATND